MQLAALDWLPGFQELSRASPHEALSQRPTANGAWHTDLIQRRNWKHESLQRVLSLVFLEFSQTHSPLNLLSIKLPKTEFTILLVQHLLKKHLIFLSASKRGVFLQFFSFSIPLNYYFKPVTYRTINIWSTHEVFKQDIHFETGCSIQ